MIVVRRSEQKIIYADPISPKDQERFWEEYIRKVCYAAIKEAMRENARAMQELPESAPDMP